MMMMMMMKSWTRTYSKSLLISRLVLRLSICVIYASLISELRSMTDDVTTYS